MQSVWLLKLFPMSSEVVVELALILCLIHPDTEPTHTKTGRYEQSRTKSASMQWQRGKNRAKSQKRANKKLLQMIKVIKQLRNALCSIVCVHGLFFVLRTPFIPCTRLFCNDLLYILLLYCFDMIFFGVSRKREREQVRWLCDVH